MNETWSHFVAWRDAAGQGAILHIEADTAAREAVARALALPKVKALGAEARLTRWLDGAQLDGRLHAVVERECGVTLDPFDEIVDAPFRLRFVPQGSPNAPPETGAEDQAIDLEADDPPDVVSGERFDVGAALVEQLSLALNPFPRKPDAVFEPPEDTGEASPFAALAALKSKLSP